MPQSPTLKIIENKLKSYKTLKYNLKQIQMLCKTM